MKITHSKAKAGHWLDAWHVDPSANRTYDFIDGLRGIAILMVVTCHYIYARDTGSPLRQFLLGFSGTLGLGVNLFFTLSGFLIAWPFWKRKVNQVSQLIPPGYGWRRFWKIYPPLALSVVLLLPCYILWQGDAPVFIGATVQWLTGASFFWPVSGRLNPVMWSLVVEVHFYLAIPLLFLLSKPLSARVCLWLISGAFFVLPLTAQCLTGLSPTFAPEISDPLFTGLSFFCAGIFLAGVDNLKVWNRNWLVIGHAGWFIMLGGLLGIAWISLNPQGHAAVLSHVFGWTFILGSGCLLCYAADPQNPVVRWLCTPWLRWVGIISYEWYLFHQPMIYWSKAIWGPAGGSWFSYFIVLVTPLIASLAVAALVYYRFSLPILKYGRAKKSAQK